MCSALPLSKPSRLIPCVLPGVPRSGFEPRRICMAAPPTETAALTSFQICPHLRKSATSVDSTSSARAKRRVIRRCRRFTLMRNCVVLSGKRDQLLSTTNVLQPAWRTEFTEIATPSQHQSDAPPDSALGAFPRMFRRSYLRVIREEDRKSVV